MRSIGFVVAVVAAFTAHALFIAFGGLVLPKAKEDHGTTHVVDLLEDVKDEPKKDEEKTDAPKSEELASDDEKPPDAAEILKDPSPSDEAPALDAASLSAIEAALSGAASGGGDFAQSVDMSSGGRIGGTGKPGGPGDAVESAFSLAEIDQKPRAIFQTAPAYPSEVRDKKLEGSVTVIFVVDASGKTIDPRVERSNHPAFEKPALDAVRQWKFEPAVKAGQRVACKMRVPIRFQPR